uniref:PPC domain-containing protein n=1 Tax=Ixodes ricinus TaxID=34613 RepID=A0A0K8RAA2_IXORI
MACRPVVSSALKCHVLRLKPGDALKASLRRVISDLKLRAAFVVSCVGSVQSVTLRYASDMDGNSRTETRKERMEILSLTGTLSGNDRGHLHASLGDVNGHVIGGHVIEMEIYTTAEVVIGELTDANFERVGDSETGCDELVVSVRKT